MNKKQPKVVVIGGGTGSFTLLSSLKSHVDDLTALVNMSDDGGSTGILRDELGVLPPGDIRQCLVALSDSPKLRELFTYRFEEGSLKGHSFGNLFLSAVEKMTDNFEEAVSIASDVLRIHGKVVPMTLTNAHLVLRDPKGGEVRGEYKIGNMDFSGYTRPDISLDPQAVITDSARLAIGAADIIVIAPGNLYGSLAPALVVGGVKEALQSTSAKIAYVCNLVTKPNQTDGFLVHDYVDEIERFIGAQVVDYVLYNTETPNKDLIEKYTHDQEKIIQYDLDVMQQSHYEAIGLPLVAQEAIKHSSHDAIATSRSLIRHDAEAVSRQLMSLDKHHVS